MNKGWSACQACPGYLYQQNATTDGRDNKPGHDGESNAKNESTFLSGALATRQ